jgi:hypothetical protein
MPVLYDTFSSEVIAIRPQHSAAGARRVPTHFSHASKLTTSFDTPSRVTYELSVRIRL